MNEDQRRAFARAMLRIVDGVLAGKLSPAHAAKRLKQGAKWLEDCARTAPDAPKASEASQRLGPTMDEVRAVFEHWRTETARPRAKIESHQAIIRKALTHFSVDELKAVATYSLQDEWFQGLKDGGDRRDWPGYMYRSPRRIEELLERAAKAGIGKGGDVIEFDKARKCRELEEQGDLALKEERFDEYNDIQRRIAELTEGSG